MINHFFNQRIMIWVTLLIVMTGFCLPAIIRADVKTSCTDDALAACRQIYGECCETQCCQDYLGGAFYCDSSPECQSTPASRCQSQCNARGCQGYRVDVTTGECAECLSCCPEGAATMPSEAACQDHCRGEYTYDPSSQCCDCQGTSFTDENTCKIYCADRDQSYRYDPTTPPYCTCTGEYIPTETACQASCYPRNYAWDPNAEPSRRCTCNDSGQDDTKPPANRSVNLEVGIGSNTTAGGISYYIGMVYTFAAMIVGSVAVVMVIVGGIQYSTSAGNPAALGSAKETITSAIIGLVIVLMSYLILGVFSSRFTNLTEPVLDPITVGQSSSSRPPASRYLICGGSGGSPVCGYATGEGEDDSRCAGKAPGSPCASSAADCSQYSSSATCEGDSMCDWCEIAGGAVCLAANSSACTDRRKESCNSPTTCRPSEPCAADPSSSACRDDQNQHKQAMCSQCPLVVLKDGGPSGKLMCCSWP